MRNTGKGQGKGDNEASLRSIESQNVASELVVANIGEGKPAPFEKHKGCGTRESGRDSAPVGMTGFCEGRLACKLSAIRLFFRGGRWAREDFVGADDLAVEGAGN